MPKLNQVIAVVSQRKTDAERAVTGIYHFVKRRDVFEGLRRTYQPVDDDGDTFPPESKRLQCTAAKVMEAFAQALKPAMDVVATQEYGNQGANADISVDGTVILSNVPVTYMLFLEKKLTDFLTFANELPVLDPSRDWKYSEANGCYESDTVVTAKSKKVPKHKVLYEATDKHPAQIESYTEDVKVGEWSNTQFSGALSATEKEKLVGRIKKLQEAVKCAREEANNVAVEPIAVADKLFQYAFGAQV